eukprot:31152-Chlamydomonas_euryale.AAC.4
MVVVADETGLLPVALALHAAGAATRRAWAQRPASSLLSVATQVLLSSRLQIKTRVAQRSAPRSFPPRPLASGTPLRSASSPARPHVSARGAAGRKRKEATVPRQIGGCDLHSP